MDDVTSSDCGPPDTTTSSQRGVIHLVDCVCMLPQYAKRDPPVFHKFAVFSEFDGDAVIEKVAKCNNCGVMHRVTDICRSVIVYGHDNVRGALTIDDLAVSMPRDVADVLRANDCDLATWEHAKFNIDNRLWGSYTVISSEEVDGHRVGKALAFLDEAKIRIIPFDELVEISRAPT